MNIVNLQDYKPHLSGEAMCLQCEKKWMAVTPTGTVEGLECPECHAFKGVLLGLCNVENDYHWRCNCGCFIFSITENKGIYCLKCGTVQEFP